MIRFQQNRINSFTLNDQSFSSQVYFETTNIFSTDTHHHHFHNPKKKCIGSLTLSTLGGM